MELCNLERVRYKIIELCKNPIPMTPIGLVRELKKEFGDFYPRTKEKKVVFFLKKKILPPLLMDGFVLEYNQKDPVWEKACFIVRKYSKKKKDPTPRRISALYQTNFLYLGGGEFPIIKRLPLPDKELNLDLVIFLSKFNKTNNYPWEMLNLLISASKKENRDRLRLFLYSLPLDYSEIDLFEKVLEYGEEYSSITFPFSPNLENAKRFLKKLAK